MSEHLEPEDPQAAIEQSELRYRTLFDSIPVPVLISDSRALWEWIEQLRDRGVVDLQAYLEAHPEALRESCRLVQVTHINAAAERAIGRAAETICRDYPPNADEDFFRSFAEQLLSMWKGEPVERCEFNYRGDDGSLRNMLLNVATPIINGQPNYAEVIVTQVDITDRVEAERELRASEERYRMLAENVSDLIAVFDAECRFRYASPACRTLLGYAPSELIGLNFAEFVVADDRPRLEQTYERLMGGLSVSPCTCRIQDRVGSTRWIEARAQLLPTPDDDGGPRILVVLRDITDRQEQENILKREHALLRAILRTSAASIVVADTEGVVVFANNRAEDVLSLGDERESPLRYDSADWNLADVAGNPLPPEMHPFVQVMETGEAVFAVELSITPPGFPRRILSVNAAPLYGDGDEIEGVVFASEDITSRRQSHEKLRQRDAEIAHMARISSLGEMAAGIAHEINQPLYAISNYAAACDEVLRRNEPEQRTAALIWISRIAEQSARAGSVIRRLNDFLRKNTPSRAVAAVEELVRESVELVESLAGRKRVHIRTSIRSPLPDIHGDRILIEQVIVNLLTNAIDAVADEPERTVQIEARPYELAGFIEIRITDTGRGIAEEHWEALFRSYFTTKPHGMGMGLPIGRSIIEEHGGQLWAEPRERGACFRLTLPECEES